MLKPCSLRVLPSVYSVHFTSFITSLSFSSSVQEGTKFVKSVIILITHRTTIWQVFDADINNCEIKFFVPLVCKILFLVKILRRNYLIYWLLKVKGIDNVIP